MVDDTIFHKLSSPLAHQSPYSILEILATVQLNGPKIPLWYSNLLFELYHLGNSGCMGFNEVGATSLESDKC